MDEPLNQFETKILEAFVIGEKTTEVAEICTAIEYATPKQFKRIKDALLATARRILNQNDIKLFYAGIYINKITETYDSLEELMKHLNSIENGRYYDILIGTKDGSIFDIDYKRIIL